VERRNRLTLLEVRSEHLKDYLCARRMALISSWYRSREEIVEEEPQFEWPKPDGSYKDGEHWEGRIRAIRIRRDEPSPAIAFIVDAGGKKQTAKRLVESGSWLWFGPDLIPALSRSSRWIFGVVHKRNRRCKRIARLPSPLRRQ
jgi:hypothetical protein